MAGSGVILAVFLGWPAKCRTLAGPSMLFYRVTTTSDYPCVSRLPAHVHAIEIRGLQDMAVNVDGSSLAPANIVPKRE